MWVAVVISYTTIIDSEFHSTNAYCAVLKEHPLSLYFWPDFLLYGVKDNSNDCPPSDPIVSVGKRLLPFDAQECGICHVSGSHSRSLHQTSPHTKWTGDYDCPHTTWTGDYDCSVGPFPWLCSVTYSIRKSSTNRSWDDNHGTSTQSWLLFWSSGCTVMVDIHWTSEQ